MPDTTDPLAPLREEIALLDGVHERYKAERPHLSSVDEAEKAADFARRIATAKNDAEAWAKRAEEPHKTALAAIRKARGDLLDPLDRADTGIRRRLLEWFGKRNDPAPLVTMHGTRALTRTDRVVEISDEAAIPRTFLKIDTAAVKAALKRGDDVPGARLVDRDTLVVSKA